MKLKVVVTGLTVIVAAGIFLLTLRAGSRTTSSGDKPLTPPQHLRVGVPGEGDGIDMPRVGQYYVHFRDKNSDVLYELFGSSVEPLPQGVWKVQKPMARIHMVPGRRVLEIRAERGAFVAPGNVPRSGQFEGLVTVRWFETTDDAPLQVRPGSPHELIRLRLEQAKFDLELGQIRGDGVVLLHSESFDFVGEDLDLTYNELKKQLDRLEVAKGRMLRLREQAAGPKTGTKKVSDTVSPSSTSKTVSDTISSTQTQFYRAQLSDSVTIEAHDLKVAGSRLETLFGIRERMKQVSETAGAGPSAGQQAGDERPTATAAQSLAGLAPEPDFVAETTELLNRPMKDNEVLVRWHGPLVIVPEAGRPQDLEHDDDVYLRLEGEPVILTTPQEDRITAGAMDYLFSEARLRLIGTAGHPMEIDSLRAGAKLTAPLLVMAMDRLEGQILGAGRIVAHGETGVADKLAMARSLPTTDDRRMPPGSMLKWTDRVDVSFYGQSPGDRSTADSGVSAGKGLIAGGSWKQASKVQAIKAVVVRGEATLVHPQGQMQADVLSAVLSDPQTGRQSPRSITAAGHVRVTARLPDPEPPLSVESDQLSLSLLPNLFGQIQPSLIEAKGHVKAWQGDRALWSDRAVVDLTTEPQGVDPAGLSATGKPSSIAAVAIDAMLGAQTQPGAKAGLQWTDTATSSSPAATQPVAAAAARPPLRIRRITTEGDVRVRLAQYNVVGFAQRVTGDPQQIEMFGSAAAPAMLIRPDGLLSGQHIVMDPTRKSVHVLGQGVAAFLSSSGDARRSEELLSPPSLPTAAMSQPLVTIHWQDNMHFYSSSSVAQFYGNVEVLARKDKQLTRLRSSELDMAFQSQVAQQLSARGEDRAPAEGGTKPKPQNRAIQDSRLIRTITAKGPVEFLEEQWADHPGGQLLTRVRLEGPQMQFDSMLERIQVPGQGTLLLEDRRPAKSDTASGIGEGIHLNGRGATLFAWMGELVLDAAYNDMRIVDQVQMLYIPQGDNRRFQIDCRQFVADLEATGGLGVWFSSPPPQPALKVVSAEGNVRVLGYDKEVTTDRLVYTAFDNTLVLTANQGNLTRIMGKDSTTPAGIRQLKWNLKTDRIEAVDPGRMTVPAGAMGASSK
ncbi:MAG: hypothetical protein IT440_03770 [Phycisphaeraceae bacterium]|nr:hypothetical protein [Phycisphaeraceae bacterium]